MKQWDHGVALKISHTIAFASGSSAIHYSILQSQRPSCEVKHRIYRNISGSAGPSLPIERAGDTCKKRIANWDELGIFHTDPCLPPSQLGLTGSLRIHNCTTARAQKALGHTNHFVLMSLHKDSGLVWSGFIGWGSAKLRTANQSGAYHQLISG